MSETNTDILTVTHHILASQQKSKQASGDLSILVTAMTSACKWISNVVRKAELLSILGLAGETNVQNEAVQKLDVLSNKIMINMLKATGKASLLVSEEDEDAIVVKGSSGHYAVVFDPLDGSSNIDCAVSVGTIFGIYKLNTTPPAASDVLRPGSEMVCAGYCLYGSSTILVLTLGHGVDAYTLDPNIGEFVLSHASIKIGSKKIYSINEGNASTFNAAVTEYLEKVKSGKPKPYSARYVGSMVADVHRTLLYGGIFMYPGGKLRVLYECFPMAFIMEQAGGKASTGSSRILDHQPTKLHERAPIFLGSKEEVEIIEELYKKHNLK
jgi:fructose-1,6-bisphosphatase I